MKGFIAALCFSTILGLVAWAFVVAGFLWQGGVVLALWYAAYRLWLQADQDKVTVEDLVVMDNQVKAHLAEAEKANDELAGKVAEIDRLHAQVRDAKCVNCGRSFGLGQ